MFYDQEQFDLKVDDKSKPKAIYRHSWAHKHHTAQDLQQKMLETRL